MVFILSSLCCGNMHDWKFGSGKMFSTQNKFSIAILGMHLFFKRMNVLYYACDFATIDIKVNKLIMYDNTMMTLKCSSTKYCHGFKS